MRTVDCGLSKENCVAFGVFVCREVCQSKEKEIYFTRFPVNELRKNNLAKRTDVGETDLWLFLGLSADRDCPIAGGLGPVKIFFCLGNSIANLRFTLNKTSNKVF